MCLFYFEMKMDCCKLLKNPSLIIAYNNSNNNNNNNYISSNNYK